MPIQVILSPLDGEEEQRQIMVAPGSSVNVAIMEAKSQGLEIPEHRNTYLDGLMIEPDEENDKIVGQDSTIVVAEKEEP